MSGDRPYILALFAVVVALAAMLVGPLQSYGDASGRVAELAAQRAELSRHVDELEERSRRLREPDEIELKAREQLGMVKPGELPYVVTRPEPELEIVRPDGRSPERRERPSWWQRLGRAFAGLFSAR